MKLDPKSIEIVMPQRLNMTATNKLSVSKKYMSVSSSLVRKMNCPEYARIYVDVKAKQLFIVPCKPEAEGARKFYREKAKSKTVSVCSPSLTKLIAQIASVDLEKNKFSFDCEEVEGRTTTLGFDLTKYN